jgi:hypothetical protein
MLRLSLAAAAPALLGACGSPAPAAELWAAEAAPPACTVPAAAPSPDAGLAEFSEYAWSLFAAVNWPVQGGQRGVPDCERPIGAPGPTVWESYKTVGQLFLPRARDPGPWEAGPIDETLRFQAKAPRELPVEESIRQAVGGWLIDRAGNPTYYQIAVNRTAYDYVRSNAFYDADTLNAAARVSLPEGALEVKAAWRIVDRADSARFHTARARVMEFDSLGNPTGTYRTATVGLVGLHVVYRAPGFPQWTWATFEHVDNAPDAAHPTGDWSYYRQGCTGPYCTPNVSPLQADIPYGVANQITRLSPVRAAVDSANARWRARLAGTRFANYRLIAPQWPTDPDDPGVPDGAPTPATVANVVMESYIQPTSSCMDCHSTARVPNGRIKTDYSFIFLFAQPSAPAAGGAR